MSAPGVLPRYPFLKKTTLAYTSVSLDNSYGQTITVDLKPSGLVYEYNFVVSLGTLNGGSSPAWSVSASNPLITHVSVIGDNVPIFDADYQLFMEETKLILLGVRDLTKKGAVFESTALFAAKYRQLHMKLTIAPLSQVTTGSPTGTTGTTLYLQEVSTPYDDLVKSPAPIMVADTRKLQISSMLNLIGRNNLNRFLSLDGGYAYILFAAMTGNSVNYANLTDSLVNEMKLWINSQNLVFDDYWSLLKAHDQAVLQNMPDTGFALKIFSADGVESDVLDLARRDYQDVDLEVDTTNTGVLAALKTEIFSRGDVIGGE
jgi:hypothetical protein